LSKIAIIGKLPSKFQAPYNDPEWQIWGCNVHHDMQLISRFDKWFDLHQNPSKYDFDVITKKDYPLDEAINLVGGNYFNNSIAYMVAYAIFNA